MTQPAPKKPASATQELKQVVAQATQATPVLIDIPTSCEQNMVEIYSYAQSAGIVNDKDIPDLCKPFTRAKLARVMVDYALKLALVEPNLSRRCSFNDVKEYNNEDQFYMALACDFGFLGVNNDGVANASFNP